MLNYASLCKCMFNYTTCQGVVRKNITYLLGRQLATLWHDPCKIVLITLLEVLTRLLEVTRLVKITRLVEVKRYRGLVVFFVKKNTKRLKRFGSRGLVRGAV